MPGQGRFYAFYVTRRVFRAHDCRRDREAPVFPSRGVARTRASLLPALIPRNPEAGSRSETFARREGVGGEGGTRRMETHGSAILLLTRCRSPLAY